MAIKASTRDRNSVFNSNQHYVIKHDEERINKIVNQKISNWRKSCSQYSLFDEMIDYKISEFRKEAKKELRSYIVEGYFDGEFESRCVNKVTCRLFLNPTH